MAVLRETPVPVPSDIYRHMELLEALHFVSEKVDESVSLIGAVYSAPVADGLATYVVVEDSPLTVAHVPVLDAYTLPTPHIKGLDRDDICAQLTQRRHLRALGI